MMRGSFSPTEKSLDENNFGCSFEQWIIYTHYDNDIRIMEALFADTITRSILRCICLERSVARVGRIALSATGSCRGNGTKPNITANRGLREEPSRKLD